MRPYQCKRYGQILDRELSFQNNYKLNWILEQTIKYFFSQRVFHVIKKKNCYVCLPFLYIFIYICQLFTTNLYYNDNRIIKNNRTLKFSKMCGFYNVSFN